MRITPNFLTSICALLIAFSATAQISMPRPSPNCTLTQELGIGDITITYSRPGVKDREVFGDLVPFDKPWRTGANQATTVEFTNDVKIEGKELKAGKYVLITVPGKESWKWMFSSNPESVAWEYDEADIALTVESKPMTSDNMVETMVIDVNDVRDDKAMLWILWANTSVGINISMDTEAAVLKNIEETMAGPSWYEKYQAARYYFENGKDLKTAHNWIKESTDEAPRFWTMKWRAEIEAATGDYKTAITTAEKSKAMAIEEGNDDYVKMNEDNIAKWSKK